MLLELSDVHARYGAVRALHGVSLAVGEGEVVAVLGANGAGKTTTLRAISGTVRRTGAIRLGGRRAPPPERPPPPAAPAAPRARPRRSRARAWRTCRRGAGRSRSSASPRTCASA